MENRFEKIASARKKLRDHQEKRKCPQLDDTNTELNQRCENISGPINATEIVQELVLEEKKSNYGVNEPEDGMNYNAESSHNPAQISVEMLIASKRHLETQISTMQTDMAKLLTNHDQATNENLSLRRHIESLQNEISSVRELNNKLCQQLQLKDIDLNRNITSQSSILEENKVLIEQLDFAKTAISSKDNEIQSLNNTIGQMKSELDSTQLHINQLTNGTVAQVSDSAEPQTEELLQKIFNLEEQIKNMQKEHSQIIAHYEHFMAELNGQNKILVTKNNELSHELHERSAREVGLIEQISTMEIRIQQLLQSKEQQSLTANMISTEAIKEDSQEITELKQKYNCIQVELENMKTKIDKLQNDLTETIKEKEELELKLNSENENRTINVSKLQDDITNDKVAAQLATEQNKKLKKDVQELEEAFVKMSKDKLKLTEMLEAEKYLSRELTLKLAEVDENAKDMAVKLNAKDTEMLRLQNCCRELEKKIDNLIAKNNSLEHQSADIDKDVDKSGDPLNNETTPINKVDDLRKEDAMSKLQERFLKIMNEVADLSDEKHRLEHIILQLQNETDTICEYIALYQQQRSVLKHREEERLAQFKLYRAECDKMKANLDELAKIFTQLPSDKIINSSQVIEIIKSMRDNCLVNPDRQGELRNFHPCACCSGVLLDV